MGATCEEIPHLCLLRIELPVAVRHFLSSYMTRAPSKMQASLGEGEFSTSQGSKGQKSELVATMTKPGLRIQFIISLTLNTT